MSNGQVIKLGNISGVFGVKGWVKIHSHTEPREAISNYAPWILKKKGVERTQRVVKLQRNGKSIIAQLDHVDDRNQAESLIGYDIYVEREQLQKLPEQEYYWTDLEGLDVFNLKNVQLGKIDYLIETGANDVLIVRNESGGEHLVPYIDDVILEVDLNNRRMKVDWDEDF